MRIRSTGLPQKIQQSPWLYVPKPKKTPALRVFCFPYAGGTAEVFHQWAEGFPPAVEMCAIRLPGRSTRLKDPPLTRMTSLVEEVAKALQPFLETPYVFFGHSMGTLVLYELTRYLEQQQQPLPVHLFVAGHRAPHIPSVQPALHALSDAELLSVARAQAVPEEILQNAELVKALLPVIRADFEVIDTWRFTPSEQRLPMPIWGLAGANDTTAPKDQVALWQEHSQQPYKMFVFPGKHFFLHQPDSRAGIIRLITTAISPHLAAQCH